MSHPQKRLHHQGGGVGPTEQTCEARLPLVDATPVHSRCDFPAFGAGSSEAVVVDCYPESLKIHQIFGRPER